MPRTPSLDALRIFVIAARHLSFTRAAQELNLTQSAVSHRIRALEDEMGLTLFNRMAQRLELTDAGRALAHSVGQAIGHIDRSVADLRGPVDARHLSVTMLPSVASHWLIPRLPRLADTHPDLEVQVIADARVLDLRTAGIDLAVRFGAAPPLGYAVMPLMSDLVLPVCSPEFLERNGAPGDMDGLLRLPLLHDSATEADGSRTDWRAWLDYFGRHEISARAGQRFSEASMLINAAVSGLGVALARGSLVADRLQSGVLSCPLRMTAPTAFSYYLIGAPETLKRPHIVAFSSWLMAEAAGTEAFMRAISSKSAVEKPCTLLRSGS